MLFNTVNKYNYTSTYYPYTIVENNDGTTSKIYSTNGNVIDMTLSTTLIGDVVIQTNQKLQKGGLLRLIRDRNNIPVYPDGVWEITQTQPILNAVGIREGYKYRAKLIAGDL